MSAYPLHFLEPTFAEFFAGIGLMRIGLEKAGWKIRFANDIDPVKEKIYTGHFQDEHKHFLLGDIHALNAGSIPTVTLATASFPCTDLSLAGRREGLAGRHSSAFWGFVDALESMDERRPPIVLLENVEGFLTSHNGQDFKEALSALNGLGYAVDAFIIDASHFVPQSRVRLFVVGHQIPQKGNGVAQRKTPYQNQLRSKKLVDFIVSHPEINWDIRELPALPARSASLSDIVEELPEDSKLWWPEDRVEYLLNQTFDRHKAIIDFLKLKVEYSYLTAFRRVRNGRSMAEIRSDGIAGCLRTPKGGSARQILLRVGRGQVKIRFVSPRECARLMGADDFTLSGKFNESLFGFGDAEINHLSSWN